MFVSWFELKNNMTIIFIHLLYREKGLFHLPILAHLICHCNSRSLLSFSSARLTRGFDDSIHRRKCLLSGHLFLLPLKLVNTDERLRGKKWWRRFLENGFVETYNQMCIGFEIFYTIWSLFYGVFNSYPKQYKLKNSKSRAPCTQALLMNGFSSNLVSSILKSWERIIKKNQVSSNFGSRKKPLEKTARYIYQFQSKICINFHVGGNSETTAQATALSNN